jgi:hypothetical protein
MQLDLHTVIQKLNKSLDAARPLDRLSAGN